MCPVSHTILQDSRRKAGQGCGKGGRLSEGMEIEAIVSGWPMDSESIAWDRDDKGESLRSETLSSPLLLGRSWDDYFVAETNV